MDNEIIDLISYLEKPDIYREEISQLQKRVQVLENTVETLRSNTDDQWKSYRRYLCSSCEKTSATCYNIHWPSSGPRFSQEINKIRRRRSLKASSILLDLLHTMKNYRCYNNLLRLVSKLQRDLVA